MTELETNSNEYQTTLNLLECCFLGGVIMVNTELHCYLPYQGDH